MTEFEFNNIKNELFKTMSSVNLTFIDKETDNKKWEKLKLYPREKEYNEKLIEVFYNQLATGLKVFFDNPKLINALNMTENTYYNRRQQVFKYFPINFRNEKLLFLLYCGTNILDKCGTALTPNVLMTLIDFINSNVESKITDEQQNNLIYFLNNNFSLFESKMKPTVYGSFEYEMNEYNKVNRGLSTIGYEKFKDIAKINDEYYGKDEDNDCYRQKYLNKKLGNIGEFIAFNHFKNELNYLHVASLSSGFGYDQYYQLIIDKIIEEHLQEVKTTSKSPDYEDDFFTISTNEFAVMLNCLNNHLNANYEVCRIFYNIENNKSEMKILNYNKSNNTFEYEKKALYEVSGIEGNKLLCKKIKTFY